MRSPLRRGSKGLFDRFKKKASEPATSGWPKSPEPDTSCLLLLDRVLGDNELAVEFLRKAVGSDAVVNVIAIGNPLMLSLDFSPL